MSGRTIVLSGPTASGKSGLAVEVAVRLRDRGVLAEVVNADSMLVYRGMDIGTAKPTLEERRGVPHHLVDILDITETATVADFQRLARAAIADVRGRGGVPILVGGSALYLRAILDDFEFPGTDAVVRAKWQDELDRVGSLALHERLAASHPHVAAGIEPGNGRRIVRALEVIDLTGDYTSTLPEWTYLLPDVVQFGLDIDRAELDERIEARVDAMWRDGLVDEVRALEARGLREGITASRGLGYRQVLAMLDGALTEDEAREQIVTGTRRFARKQLGWFRRDARIRWLSAKAGGAADSVVGAALT